MNEKQIHVHYFPCPWCYAIITVTKDEEEENYLCPVCKREFTQEDLEEARKKEEEE